MDKKGDKSSLLFLLDLEPSIIQRIVENIVADQLEADLLLAVVDDKYQETVDHLVAHAVTFYWLKNDRLCYKMESHGFWNVCSSK